MMIMDPTGHKELEWLEDVWVYWMFFCLNMVGRGEVQAVHQAGYVTGVIVRTNLVAAYGEDFTQNLCSLWWGRAE